MALSPAEQTALRTAAGSPAYYNDGNGTMENQFNTQYWIKKSLVEAAPKQWFSQLSSTVNAPKHMGKKLVRYLYLPLLDDRNDNDQGIDAAGAVITNGNLYGSSRDINKIMEFQPHLTEHGGRVNRVNFSRTKLEGTFEEYGFFYEYTEDELQFDTDAELKQHNYREAIIGASKVHEDRLQIDIITSAGTILYGGTATARNQLSGDIGGTISEVTYDGLVTLTLKMDDLGTPTDTRIVTGSTNSDTKTVKEARLMYVGTEVMQSLLRLTDFHGERALIERKQYAAATVQHAVGEYGAIEGYRVIKVGKEMVKASAQGAIEGVNGANAGYRASLDAQGDSRYDVFFMLVIGEEAYQTISFKTSTNGSNKFDIFTQAPKPKIRHTSDPYGKIGFTVISWYYGFLPLRTERIARIEVVAKRA